MSEKMLLIGRVVLFLGIIVYFVFDYFERRLVRDEREEFVHLKSLELVHKATTVALAVFVIANFFWRDMPALVPVIGLIGTSMYMEIGGKIYYRRKY